MEDFECQSGGGWKETTPQDTQVQSFLPHTGQIHSVWWLLPCPLDEIEDNALWPTCSILFTSVMKKKKCNSPKFRILLKVKISFLSQIWGVSIFSVWSSTSLFLPSLLVQGIGRCVQSQGGGVRRKGLPRWECCNLPLVSCGTEKCSKLTFLKWPTFMDPSVISLGKHLTTALLRSISYLLPHMYV